MLRDLFWMVLVVAALLGWWVDHSRLAADLRAAHSESADIAQILGAQGEVIREMAAQTRAARAGAQSGESVPAP